MGRSVYLSQPYGSASPEDNEDPETSWIQGRPPPIFHRPRYALSMTRVVRQDWFLYRTHSTSAGQHSVIVCIEVITRKRTQTNLAFCSRVTTLRHVCAREDGSIQRIS